MFAAHDACWRRGHYFTDSLVKQVRPGCSLKVEYQQLSRNGPYSAPVQNVELTQFKMADVVA
jgi:hypothetical protein